jgi:hypothetical protein
MILCQYLSFIHDTIVFKLGSEIDDGFDPQCLQFAESACARLRTPINVL